MSRKTNQAGIDLIKFYEGLQLTTYKDIVGIETIGYGHTGPEAIPGRTITESEATTLLETDLGKFETGVDRLLSGPPITDNSFSALVSFSYNVGVGALATSLLLKFVNKGLIPQAADEFLKWCHAGGKSVPGLIARRRAERDLFLRV